MNNKLIEQIKSLKGVEKVILPLPEYETNQVVVVFEPQEPVLHDEYGVPLFEGDKYWWSRDVYFSSSKAFTPYHNKNCIINLSIKTLVENEDCKIFASKESAKKWIEDNKPEQPIYVDPETGDEFFEGDECFYYSKESCFISKNKAEVINFESQQIERYSKIYKDREKCEIALAHFILNKYKDE